MPSGPYALRGSSRASARWTSPTDKKKGGIRGSERSAGSGGGIPTLSPLEFEANLLAKMLALSIGVDATELSSLNRDGNDELEKFRVICLERNQKEREDGLCDRVVTFIFNVLMLGTCYD